MLFLGFFQISIPYGLVFWGEQYISSGLSAVLFATNTFFVVIFAHIMLNERLTRVKAVGVVAAFIGLVVIFWRDIGITQGFIAYSSLYGGLAVLGSAASGGLANVVGKGHAHEIDPSANVLIQSITGTLALSSMGLVTERNSAFNLTPVAIVAILYLGVVGSALAFVGMYWLLKRTTATNVSLITFIAPIIALMLGWLVLRELPDPNVGLGAALILAGVYLTIKPTDRYF